MIDYLPFVSLGGIDSLHFFFVLSVDDLCLYLKLLVSSSSLEASKFFIDVGHVKYIFYQL